MRNCKIIYWPLSQICITCQHGRLVDTKEPATYLCLTGQKPNNSTGECKKYSKKKETHVWMCPLCSNKQNRNGRCAVCGDYSIIQIQ